LRSCSVPAATSIALKSPDEEIAERLDARP
jgi:hypothetical protein